MSPGAPYDPGLSEVLARAGAAYRRRDDAEFLACMGDAVRRAPQRIDLLVCLANEQIQLGHAAVAMDIFEDLAVRLPNDPENLFRLAHWRKFAGNEGGAWEAYGRLAELRPERASDLMRIWSIIDGWLVRRVSDAVPDAPSGRGKTAVVTLGLKLAPDGSPRQGLIDRLEKSFEVFRAYPDAILIPTGGVPQSGRVETTVMRRWLEERGVPPERIFDEGYARDVVENLLFAREIMDLEGIGSVIAVTAAENVRRAGAGLDIIAWTCGSAWKADAVAASGGTFASFHDDGRDRLKLFRDALRSYGMPTMTAYPYLAER